MYKRKRYQDGGPAPEQGQDPEMQMVQQILQAIQQLSPEAQQVLMEQLQGGVQPQQEQTYQPPMRYGGRYR